MKIKYLTYLLFFSGLFACHKEANTNSKYSINLKNQIETKQSFSFNDIAIEVSVVELKQGKGTFISGANKIYITRDAHTLLLNGNTIIHDYDNQGVLQSTIGKIGKGPGEYLEANDFCLSENESTINILSRHYIHIFNRNSSKFQRKIDITSFRKDDYLPEYITNDGNEGFFLWDSNPSKLNDFTNPFFCLWHIDKNGKVLNKSFERTEFVLELPRFTKSFDGGTWIRPLEGSMFLYKSTPDKLINEAYIEFGNKSIPKSYFSQYDGIPYQFLDRWINSDYYKMPNEFYDDLEHLIFSFGGPNGITCSCLYNKNDMSIIAKQKNKNNPEILFADSLYFYAYYDPSSSDVNKMDSIFRMKIQDEVTYDKSFLFKFKLK